METIDYTQPLRLECLLVDIDERTKTLIKIPFVAFIEWKDIVSVEQFVKRYLVPDDNRPMVNIVTIKGLYLVVNEDIEEAGRAWAKYKIWANSLRNLIFTQN